MKTIFSISALLIFSVVLSLSPVAPAAMITETPKSTNIGPVPPPNPWETCRCGHSWCCGRDGRSGQNSTNRECKFKKQHKH